MAKQQGMGWQHREVTGSGVYTKVLVAGCAPLADENRGDRKEFSSLQGFHAVYFTPCSSAHTHTHTHTHRTLAENPVTVCVNEMLD